MWLFVSQRVTTMIDFDDVLKRRVAVEQFLFDCASGKRPLPDKDVCMTLALKLGTPTKEQKITLPKKPEKV